MRSYKDFVRDIVEFGNPNDQLQQQLVPGPIGQGPRYGLGQGNRAQGASPDQVKRGWHKIGEDATHEWYLQSDYRKNYIHSNYVAVLSKEDNQIDFSWSLPGSNSRLRGYSSLFPRINERLRGQRKGAYFASKAFVFYPALRVTGTNDQSQGARKMWMNMATSGIVPYMYFWNSSSNKLYGNARGQSKRAFKAVYRTAEWDIRITASGSPIPEIEAMPHDKRFVRNGLKKDPVVPEVSTETDDAANDNASEPGFVTRLRRRMDQMRRPAA